MRTIDLIEGLTVLKPYYNKPNGFNTGADHDVIYAFTTDRPVQSAALKQLVKLGWYQDSYKYNEDEDAGDFEAKHYDPSEGWRAFT